jgi:excisionase family DNA binding protein
MPIRDLSTHPLPYVSVSDLASYWLVSRKQVYKQIDAGTLPALRLGPRLFRISTADARLFERHAKMRPPDERVHATAHTSASIVSPR